MIAPGNLQKRQLVALRRFGQAPDAFETQFTIPGDRALKVTNADAGVKEYRHNHQTEGIRLQNDTHNKPGVPRSQGRICRLRVDPKAGDLSSILSAVALAKVEGLAKGDPIAEPRAEPKLQRRLAAGSDGAERLPRHSLGRRRAAPLRSIVNWQMHRVRGPGFLFGCDCTGFARRQVK
jgi:hypothetical protein